MNTKITNDTRLIDLTVGQWLQINNENLDLRIANLQPQQPQIEEELMTIQMASKFLHLSVVSIHKMKKAGKIKYLRIGSRIRFRKSELLETLETRKTKKGGAKQ